jgi:hypothetical protein
MVVEATARGYNVRNENLNLDFAASTGANLRCAWAKRISQFPQYGTHALRVGRTIPWRTRTVSLLLGSRCATSRRRLLVNRLVPLSLVLLGPVIVNIILYDLFLNPTGLTFLLGFTHGTS